MEFGFLLVSVAGNMKTEFIVEESLTTNELQVDETWIAEVVGMELDVSGDFSDAVEKGHVVVIFLVQVTDDQVAENVSAVGVSLLVTVVRHIGN